MSLGFQGILSKNSLVTLTLRYSIHQIVKMFEYKNQIKQQPV